MNERVLGKVKLETCLCGSSPVMLRLDSHWCVVCDGCGYESVIHWNIRTLQGMWNRARKVVHARS